MALMGSILQGVVGIKKSIPEFKLPRSAKRVQKNQLLKQRRLRLKIFNQISP